MEIGERDRSIPAFVCQARKGFAENTMFQSDSVGSKKELSNEISLLVKMNLRLFIVEVYHGMGNRLRALASAAAIARLHKFSLVVVWRPDIHANVLIEDLFSSWPGSLTTTLSP